MQNGGNLARATGAGESGDQHLLAQSCKDAQRERGYSAHSMPAGVARAGEFLTGRLGVQAEHLVPGTRQFAVAAPIFLKRPFRCGLCSLLICATRSGFQGLQVPRLATWGIADDVSTGSGAIPERHRSDVDVLWDYHHMGHTIESCDVAIGLGSHDLGVAAFAVDQYHRGMFPRIVFTGANAPTTVDSFPRGEAVHYREYALENGVPNEAILVEPQATNTSENITFTRALLGEHGIDVETVMLISRPYQQRRAYATCRKLWPEVNVMCASRPLSLEDYVTSIGDAAKVINMLVGDTQRITIYADRGHAIPQHIPNDVETAYQRLVQAGYTKRLVE